MPDEEMPADETLAPPPETIEPEGTVIRDGC